MGAWNVVWKAFILIAVLTSILPSQCLETEPKNKVNFFLLIDRSPPVIANWTPSAEMLNTSVHTELVHPWVLAVVNLLLQDAFLKRRVAARVVVLMLDRNNDTITVEADYFSPVHWSGKHVMPGLRFAYVQPYPFDAVDFERIKRNISHAIATNKKRAYWEGLTEIVIWHVPYDGDDPAQIHHWLQMHRPTADMMVALPYTYWSKTWYQVYPEANVIVAHTLAEKAYTMWAEILPSMQSVRGADQLFNDMWAIFYSCRAEMKHVPCHYNKRGACVMQKVYIPRGEKHLLKYCRNGTEESSCPHGQGSCDQLCANDSDAGPCSVTCGEGMKTLRPRNSTNKLIKYCKSMNVTCNLAPCARTVETTMRLGNGSEVRNCCTKTVLQDRAMLAPWKVTAIVVTTTVVLCGAVIVTACCVGQEKRRLVMNQRESLVPMENPPMAVANGTNAK